jgi:hypothetical protein
MAATIEVYQNDYAAKFAREAKQRPTEWFMKPVHGGCELHHVAAPDTSNERRKLHVVKSDNA